MKNFILILIIFISLDSFAQKITLQAKENNESNFDKALRNLDNISFYDFKFVDNAESKSLKYKVILTEFIKGIEVSQVVFIESNPNLPIGNFENKELPFSIISKFSDDRLKIMFTIAKVINYKKTFELKNEDRFDFNIFVNPKSEFEINKKYLFCAIIKPIKISENTYRNCDFNSAIDDYKDWYTIFGLDKYYIFEIEFKN